MAACASQHLPPQPGMSLVSQYLLLCLRRLITGSICKVIVIESAGMPSNGIIDPICSQHGNAEKHWEFVPYCSGKDIQYALRNNFFSGAPDLPSGSDQLEDVPPTPAFVRNGGSSTPEQL